MAKVKKKRNKAYTGKDAAITRPSVTRIQAVHRSKPAQWWLDNKRVAKPALIIAGIVAALGMIIYEIVRIATS